VGSGADSCRSLERAFCPVHLRVHLGCGGVGSGVDAVAPLEDSLVVCPGFCVGFARWCRRKVRVARFGSGDRTIGVGVVGNLEALFTVVNRKATFEETLAVRRGVDAVQVGRLAGGLGSGLKAHAEFDEVRTGDWLVGSGCGLVWVLGGGFGCGFEALDWVEDFFAELGLE
jgi:hypothetical protein